MQPNQPLQAADLQHFHEQGYLVARQLLDIAQDIAPVIAEYEARLAELIAMWQAAGLLDDSYRDLSFSERIVRIVRDTALDYAQPLDISLPLGTIAADTPLHTGPAIFNLLRSPRLLDAVEQLIGAEIYANPVQHVRIKPPESALPNGRSVSTLLTQTPWHQDLGVIHEEADESEILTVWLPITVATEENGCLAVAPGSHRDNLVLHCPADGHNLSIAKAHVPTKPVPLPMQPGDVLFMTRTTMHTSLRNRSDSIRWSFDLRYNPIGQSTGRPWFPGFVARSQAQPELVLHDAAVWTQLWHDARRQIAQHGIPASNRWDANAVGCA